MVLHLDLGQGGRLARLCMHFACVPGQSPIGGLLEL
jgi:hypothetical protein